MQACTFKGLSVPKDQQGKVSEEAGLQWDPLKGQHLGEPLAPGSEVWNLKSTTMIPWKVSVAPELCLLTPWTQPPVSWARSLVSASMWVGDTYSEISAATVGHPRDPITAQKVCS